MKSKTLKNRYIEDSVERISQYIPYTVNVKKMVYLFDNANNKSKFNDAYSRENTYRLIESVFLLVIRGEVIFNVNNKDVVVGNHNFCVITAQSKIQLIHADPETKFIFIRMTEAAHAKGFEDLGIYKNKLINDYAQNKLLSDDEYNYFMRLYSEMHEDLSHKNEAFINITTRSYNCILHIFVLNVFNIDVKIKGQAISRQENLFRQFIELLNQYASKEREVQFYAEKLNITPKYLSTITNAYSGKNASRWIAEYVVTLAKELMKENKCRIQDVSEMLNFPSQSFFGRFFKRTAGISPKRYMMTELK